MLCRSHTSALCYLGLFDCVPLGNDIRISNPHLAFYRMRRLDLFTERNESKTSTILEKIQVAGIEKCTK